MVPIPAHKLKQIEASKHVALRLNWRDAIVLSLNLLVFTRGLEMTPSYGPNPFEYTNGASLLDVFQKGNCYTGRF